MERATLEDYADIVYRFPAYLQGMESLYKRHASQSHLKGFPAYLQGMERRLPATARHNRPPGSQPTYKEWKDVTTIKCWEASLRSQPTYKEWKAGYRLLLAR